MVQTGLGIKAATITPEAADDVGSPNRILRERIGGKVIMRTGRRIPGVSTIAGVHHPISVCRMAVGDAYGAEQWRELDGDDELAHRTETIRRSDCRAVAEFAFLEADRLDGRVYGGPKWTVSPIYEGMLKEEMDAAAERHPETAYEPVLIDATLAGMVSGAADTSLVIPCLNRDGDLLSDLVLPLFGSIAGAESVLLALDDSLNPTVAMSEAPHGTAPALEGKDVANPLAMILAAAAVLHYAGTDEAEPASRAIYSAVDSTLAAGVKTSDLGGHASTTEFTNAVIAALSL
jgi:isocitrate/isopropylmalate dehydrogenase